MHSVSRWLQAWKVIVLKFCNRWIGEILSCVARPAFHFWLKISGKKSLIGKQCETIDCWRHNSSADCIRLAAITPKILLSRNVKFKHACYGHHNLETVNFMKFLLINRLSWLADFVLPVLPRLSTTCPLFFTVRSSSSKYFMQLQRQHGKRDIQLIMTSRHLMFWIVIAQYIRVYLKLKKFSSRFKVFLLYFNFVSQKWSVKVNWQLSHCPRDCCISKEITPQIRR